MRIVGAHLAKFLKDLGLVLSRDPNPGVADLYLHCTIDFPRINSYPSTLGGELDGVGKKVEKDLFDLPLVSNKIPKALVNCNVEVDAVFCGALPHKGARVVYCQGKIERSNL